MKRGGRQLKIAFQTMGGDHWKAGVIILKNLCYAIRQTYQDDVHLILLGIRDRGKLQQYSSSVGADDAILFDTPERWRPLWMINAVMKHVMSSDVVLEHFLRRRMVDMVCGLTITNRYGRIPTLSWIPDFQHIHLPEMFTETERASRNRAFLKTARNSTRILLFSDAVKKDFESFAPMYAHKARVLHPTSYVPEWVYDCDHSAILTTYHIPEKFVFLPNQFWKHKNHEVVFRAVEALKCIGKRVVVVCSGYPVDYRHPGYFGELWREVSRRDIRDQITYLGLIPQEDVLLLMRQSVCVLNPSLFEGWGISVDEARSVGKQVLLSDIPAHREQNVPRAVFFRADDHEDLACKLGKIWEETPPGPDSELEEEARRDLARRIRAHAESFISIVREVIGSDSS